MGRVRAIVQTNPLLALFVVAFVVRVAFIFASGPLDPPVSWGDDASYDRIADGMVTRHEYVNTWYPPGYPLFLALVYAVFGRSWLLVRIIQAGFGAATCVLTYRLGARVFSQRAGLLAAWLLAIYPGHVFFSWRIMAETLYMLMLLVSLLLALALADNPRPLRAVVVGLTLGFAQLVKSNLFPFPVLLVVWFAFAARTGIKQRGLCLGALIAGFVLMSALTPLANFLSPAGSVHALPGNAGTGLWQGNNPLANGYFNCAETQPAGQAFIARHGFKERLEHADAFEQDRLYRTLALLWIRENPGTFLVLCLKKLNNAFGLFPRAVVFDASPVARVVHWLSYGLMAPFALAGLLLAGRRWRAWALLYAVLCSYLVMVLIFYGTPRNTILVIPCLLLFASPAMLAVRDRVFRSDRLTGH